MTISKWLTIRGCISGFRCYFFLYLKKTNAKTNLLYARLMQRNIIYPQGSPEVRVIRVTFRPGGTIPYHYHPNLLYGYVESGTMMIKYKNGSSVQFHKGES